MRTKMLLGFLAVAGIVVLLGINGLRQMRAVQDHVHELYDNRLVPIMQLGSARETTLAIRVAALYHLITKDAEAMHTFVAQIRELDGRFDEELRKYGATIVLPDEVRELQRLRGLWPEYVRERDASLALSTEGRKEEAYAYAASKAAPVYRKVSESIDILVQMNRKAAQGSVEGSERAYAWERSVTVLAIVAAVLLAVLIGLGLARLSGRPLAASVEVLESVAEGDFTRRLHVDSRDELGQMARALNRAVERMGSALSQVRRAAARTATASQQISGAAERLSAGAQEQASSLEQTAASLEEITGTVKQTADNAGQANQLAAASRETAERGGQVVREAVGAMGEIIGASKRIADIITAIDEIAFQTNLLALNAAVEAARAGEQGRGFAVVAAEVRNLAQRSAEAAKEIKGLIQDSVGKVETGSELVDRSGVTLGEIVSAVKRVTDIVAEIASASEEESAGIDQVNRAVAQMDQVVQGNAAQTEELSSTAQGLAQQATELQALVGRFKLGQDTGRPEDEAVAAATTTSAPVAPRPQERPVGGKAAAPRPTPEVAKVALAAAGTPGGHRAGRGLPDGFDEFS